MLRILTFNILAPCWASPRWYPEGLDAALLSRLYRRESTIKFLEMGTAEADVVCLQEVTDDEFKAIKSAFPHFEGYMTHNDPQYWSQWSDPEIPWEPNGCAVFVRKGVFYSLRFEDRALSDSGNHAVRFVGLHIESGKDVVVWSVHLDSDSELRSLLEQTNRQVEIIAGDINADIRNGHLEDHLFQDALKKVGNFEPTHPFTSTHPAITDHVLTRGVTPVSGDVYDFHLWAIKDEVARLEHNLAICGSDHFPVTVSVRVV